MSIDAYDFSVGVTRTSTGIRLELSGTFAADGYTLGHRPVKDPSGKIIAVELFTKSDGPQADVMVPVDQTIEIDGEVGRDIEIRYGVPVRG